MKDREPWIKLKGTLSSDDAAAVAALEKACVQADDITFKLELDYKLSSAAQRAPGTATWRMDELMAYDGDRLVGYLGAGFFGGEGATPEAMGMVHPEYRRQGVFSALHRLAVADWRGRGVKRALLLCDRRSASGRAFLDRLGVTPHHSEYEMYLREEPPLIRQPDLGISFRKAMNADAGEVARQNALYFGEERGDGDREPDLILPEEEEAKGMTIHLAYVDGKIVGKAHLQLLSGLGGIYGLGVLPEYRGRGLGRAILLEGVRRLKAAGAQEVMLQVATGNENALGLYKSCGFRTTSTMDYYALDL
jgi:mycothiol synthase